MPSRKANFKLEKNLFWKQFVNFVNYSNGCRCESFSTNPFSTNYSAKRKIFHPPKYPSSGRWRVSSSTVSAKLEISLHSREHNFWFIIISNFYVVLYTLLTIIRHDHQLSSCLFISEPKYLWLGQVKGGSAGLDTFRFFCRYFFKIDILRT